MSRLPPNDSRRPTVPISRTTIIGLAAITVAGAVVRMVGLTESLWVDELHTGWVVADGWSALVTRARLGNQSPLYFLAPWLTQSLFGPSEGALRLPSLVAGSLLPPALGLLARRAGAATGGTLLAALLTAVDPHAIFYAQEARGYAMVQLLAVLHLGLFFERLRGAAGWRVRWAWIASAVVMFYLHYTTALVVLAEAILLWTMPARWRTPPNATTRAVTLDLLVVALACLPELGPLREVVSRRGNWVHFLTPEQPWTVFDWWTYVVVPLVAFAAIVAGRAWLEQQPLYWRPIPALIGAWTAWVVVPWLIATVVSITGSAPLLLYRYLIASASALPLAAAWTLTATAVRLGRWVVGAGVLTVALSQPGPVHSLLTQGDVPPQRGEDWRGVVRRLNSRPTDDRRPILLCPGLVEDWQLLDRDPRWVSFCRFPLQSLYRLGRRDDEIRPLPTIDAHRLRGDEADLVAKAGGAWLVVRGDETLEAEVIADLDVTLASVGRRIARIEHQIDGAVRLCELVVD